MPRNDTKIPCNLGCVTEISLMNICNFSTSFMVAGAIIQSGEVECSVALSEDTANGNVQRRMRAVSIVTGASQKTVWRNGHCRKSSGGLSRRAINKFVSLALWRLERVSWESAMMPWWDVVWPFSISKS